MAEQAHEEARQVRLARNEALFRDVNERIAEVSRTVVTYGPLRFLCECSNRGCDTGFDLSHEEYERVRSNGAQFVVHPGHEAPDIEDIVERNDRFVVVRKIAHGRQVAEATDPRA